MASEEEESNNVARPSTTSFTETQPSGVKLPIPRSIPIPTDAKVTRTRSQDAYNTANLPYRVLSDITSAFCASSLVAPLITVIDKSIILRSSTSASLSSTIFTSLRSLALSPITFLSSKPFLLITTVYFSTYLAANTIDTLSSTFKPQSLKPSSTTAGVEKFAATSAVNMGLSLWKDSNFARMFGTAGGGGGGGPTKTVGKASYALFALRDSMTIFASFNLPPLLAPMLPLGKSAEKTLGRANVAQFIAPAGIQLLSTPLHLWGLDLYNRPRVRWTDRVNRVRRDWLGASFARMGRIVPAFGIGGVVNSSVRKHMLGGLD
ncbi:hypothetical protein MMC09_000813 [Bachmanniomyces sp. S44760]|nr:hypothetical protein [Bachmanniomyces sp. S44760]